MKITSTGELKKKNKIHFSTKDEVNQGSLLFSKFDEINALERYGELENVFFVVFVLLDAMFFFFAGINRSELSFWLINRTGQKERIIKDN